MPVQLYFKNEITIQDLQDFGVNEHLINSAICEVDFMLVSDIELAFTDITQNNPLWNLIRNFGYWVMEDNAEWKETIFRGEQKFVILVWH